MAEPSIIFSQFAKDFLAAGFASAVSKTCVAPLDRVRLILQNQDVSHRTAAAQRYSGIVDAFVRIPAEQGVASFWRGNLASVIRYFPSQALTFALNDWLQKTRVPWVEDGFAKKLLCGGVAGLSALTLVYPLDFARTRMAVDVGSNGAAGRSREFASLRHCLSSVRRTDGVLGWYKGFSSSALYIFLYRAWYFGLYDFYRPTLLNDSALPYYLSVFLLGQIITLTGTVALYPLDTVRRRLMMQAGVDASLVPFTHASACARHLLAREGPRGFYKGVSLTLPRCFAGGLVLALYDGFKHWGGGCS